MFVNGRSTLANTSSSISISTCAISRGCAFCAEPRRAIAWVQIGGQPPSELLRTIGIELVEKRGEVSGHSTRLNSITQFVSQVLPRSLDIACSQRADFGVMCDQRKRVRTVFPSTTESE